MRIGETVHTLETCTSTNDVARVFAEDGFEEGFAVLASSQQAGRGTKGRGWFSPAGTGLYLSVVLRPSGRSPALIPLVGGLAVRDAVREMSGLETSLKWPNDVVHAGRKLAGVLAESRWSGPHLNFVILGIGLNVGQEAADFPEDLKATATSLRIAAGTAPDRAALLARLYPALERWYDCLRAGRPGELALAAEDALGLAAGAPVRLETEGGAVEGAFGGLRPDGRLVLVIDAGERVFPASEVRAIARR